MEMKKDVSNPLNRGSTGSTTSGGGGGGKATRSASFANLLAEEDLIQTEIVPQWR